MVANARPTEFAVIVGPVLTRAFPTLPNKRRTLPRAESVLPLLWQCDEFSNVAHGYVLAILLRVAGGFSGFSSTPLVVHAEYVSTANWGNQAISLGTR
jgi:hypothetical protein